MTTIHIWYETDDVRDNAVFVSAWASDDPRFSRQDAAWFHYPTEARAAETVQDMAKVLRHAGVTVIANGLAE